MKTIQKKTNAERPLSDAVGALAEKIQAKNGKASEAVQAVLEAPAGRGVSEESFLWIPIDSLSESPFNPRKDFGDLGELVESIRSKGVLQPLLVRHKKGKADGPFELVFGHRRLRAAKKAGLEKLPCIVREISDEDAREAQMVENLQRADVNPMEEARGYRELIDKHGRSIDELAARVGKSRRSIYAKLQLCSLPKGVQDLLLEGKLPVSHALLAARVPDAKLATRCAEELSGVRPDGWALKDPLRELGLRDGKAALDIERQERRFEPVAMSYRDALRHVRQNYMLLLDAAPWKKDDETLVEKAGSCTSCPKRTGNQPELFDDVKGANVCTDPVCFKFKREAYWARTSAAHVEAGGKVLPANKTKELFDHGGNLRPSSGFVELDERPREGPYGPATSKKTWGAIVKEADLPVVLARDPEGQVHRLVDADAAKAVARKSGAIKKKKIEPASSSDRSWQKADKALREKHKRDEIAARFLIEKAVEKAEGELSESSAEKLARALAAQFLTSMGMEQAKAAADRRGLLTAKKGAGMYRSFALLDGLARSIELEKLRGLLVEAALWQVVGTSWGERGPQKKVAEEIFAALKLDRAALTKTALAEHAAAQAKAKAEKKGAAPKEEPAKVSKKKRSGGKAVKS